MHQSDFLKISDLYYNCSKPASLNRPFAMYRPFYNVNTGNAIKYFDAGLNVMRAVPERTYKFFLPYFIPQYLYQ